MSIDVDSNEDEAIPLQHGNYSCTYSIQSGFSTLTYQLITIYASLIADVDRSLLAVSDEGVIYNSNSKLSKVADPCLIHKYARHGDLKSIKKAVEDLPTRKKLQYITGMDSSQLTPLHYACRYHNKDIVEYLLENMVDVNARDQEGLTPLHYAVRYSFNDNQLVYLQPSADTSSNSHRSIVIQLIAKGARKDAKDRYHLTPLHYAAMKNNYEAVEDILTYNIFRENVKQQRSLIEARDENGMTPLLRSASHGSEKVLEYLLDVANADLFAIDRQQNTALHLACQLELHCESEIEAKNSSEDRALHLAVDANCTSIVEALIEFDCDVNATRAFGNTALHSAASKGYKNIVQMLYCANADILAINNIWETPLHNAARYNQFEVVKYICQLDVGGTVNNKPRHPTDETTDDKQLPNKLVQTEIIEALNVDHETPFLVAVSDGHLNTVQYLLERFKDYDDDLKAALINCPNKFHETAMHIAAINGYQEICETLHEAGALLNARDDNQETPLHFAAKGGKSNIVKKLLEWDAKLLIDTNETSNTALHLAAAKGKLIVVVLL
uniref:ANK_REP_REGION domain-containing protein n=1 Tax=Syphacia muris TaxID=451379 RepID=A0A0N5AW09_9BILA